MGQMGGFSAFFSDVALFSAKENHGITLWNSSDGKAVKGAVSRNSAKLGNYKMPVKLRET